jgi:hypothetical protein
MKMTTIVKDNLTLHNKYFHNVPILGRYLPNSGISEVQSPKTTSTDRNEPKSKSSGKGSKDGVVEITLLVAGKSGGIDCCPSATVAPY